MQPRPRGRVDFIDRHTTSFVRTYVRITSLTTLVLAACSGSAPPRSVPPPPVARASAAERPPPLPGPAIAAEPVASTTETPELIAPLDPEPQVTDRCILSTRYPDLTKWTDADVEPRVFDSENGGRSLDELGEEARSKVPISGVCDVRTRDKVEHAIVSEPGGKLGAAKPWDHHTSVTYRDLVANALELTADEQHQLDRDGMVVPARLGYATFASAYYDIHRAQLPIFVSADSIMHAIYASHDVLLARLESQELVGRLDRALALMHCQIATIKDYPKEVAQDLDLYLTVARTLLANAVVRSELGQTSRATELADLIRRAGALTKVELFGRERAFDASMYTPRGHYAGDPELEAYFRTAMWMSRLELNLVSRDTRSSTPGIIPNPAETPREAVDALALADLAQRTGALTDLAAIDRAWAAFAGGREDVSLEELVKLRKQANIGKLEIPGSADKLRKTIGTRFPRTVNVFPNPNVPNLPVIATAIGPRITPDTVALGALPSSTDPNEAAANLGFALGHDRARAYLPPRSEWGKLAAARTAFQQASAHGDAYGAWLEAIVALAHTPKGQLPSFMATSAFADLRLDTALAAYGQLRHNHVLIAAQLYDVGGCEIPDGYVEPVPEVYAALVEWAKRGEQTFAALDRKDKTGGVKYFKRVQQLATVLRAITVHELAGKTLTTEEKRFLAMAVEMREAEAWNYSGSFPVPTYDGWYIDLFPDTDVAFHTASFIADYATHIHEDAQWIDYLGAKGPHLGVFVVDVDGAPRLMAGPVAQAFAATGPLDHRYTDQTADTATSVMAWAASYTAAAPTEVPLTVTVMRPGATLPRRPRGTTPAVTPGIVIETTADRGDATIELRDHHFVTLETLKTTIVAGKTTVPISDAVAPKVESVVVHVGNFAGRVDLDVNGRGSKQFGR